ncbi:ATP-binding protein [Streptomyces sp. NPDC052040]|uniref:ATP-binding protein n=1 Tax=Streptomyces sp. NPDC052040 TaxID=3365682 RepID=UPI0037CDFC54
MAAAQLTLSVPALPAAVTAARHAAMDAIASWDAGLSPSVVHTAEVVISELVTNAVRHAGTGPVSLTMQVVGPFLRIEVYDTSPRLPRPDIPDADSESGRGLLLVAALTDRHGAEPTANGKRCWAEIDLRPNPEPTADTPCQRNNTGLLANALTGDRPC